MEYSIDLPLDAVITLVFYLVLMAYVIFSLVFYYHWNAYALSKSVTNLTYLIFAGLTLPLVAIMGLIVVIM